MYKGSCLCGAVTFEIDGDLSPPSACHCGQCRKQSGHVWASTWTHQDNLNLSASDTIKWYKASDMARRGFCGQCGSLMFWQHTDEDTISISMGAFDDPTGLALSKHIFVADKGNYYDITDDLPQRAQ